MAARTRLAFVGAAIGMPCSVKWVHFGRAGSGEADRRAIARSWLAVAGPRNDKSGLVAAIENPAVAERSEVLDAQCARRGVVERYGLLIIGRCIGRR